MNGRIVGIHFTPARALILLALLLAVIGVYIFVRASAPATPAQILTIHRFISPAWNLDLENWPASGLEVSEIKPGEIIYPASGWNLIQGEIALASLQGRFTYFVSFDGPVNSATIRIRARTWGVGSLIQVRLSRDGNVWSEPLLSQRSSSRRWTETTHSLEVPAEYLERSGRLFVRFEGSRPTINEFVQLAGFEVVTSSIKSVETGNRLEILAKHTSDWITDNFLSMRVQTEVRELFVSNPGTQSGAANTFDYARRTFGPPFPDYPMGVAAPEGVHSYIRMDFTKPIEFDSLSIFFPGDLHGISSRLPRSIDLYVRTGKKSWALLDRTGNFAQSVYERSFARTIETDSIRLRVADAADGKDVVYTDIRFYRDSSASVFEALGQTLSENRRHPLAYFAYILAFAILLIAPGYAILDLARRWLSIDLSPAELGVFAPIVSLLILAVSTLAHLFVVRDIPLWTIAVFGFAGLLYVLRKRRWQDLLQRRSALWFVLAAAGIATLMQIQRDLTFSLPYIERYIEDSGSTLQTSDLGYHADGLFPWAIARFFLYAPSFQQAADQGLFFGFGPSVVFARGQLLPLAITPILGIFGDRHLVYQMFVNVLMGFLYGSLLLLLRRGFGGKTATLTILLTLISVPVTLTVLNTELYLKYIAYFPVVLAYYAVIRGGRAAAIVAGGLFVIGFALHPSAILFAPGVGVAYLVRYRLSAIFLRYSAAAILPVLIAGLVWLFAIPLLEEQATGVVEAQSIYKTRVSLTTIDDLSTKAVNLANLFFPQAIPPDGSDPIFDIRSVSQWITRARLSIVGVVTPALFGLLVWSLFRGRNRWILWTFGIGPPLVWIALLNVYSHGGYSLMYSVSVPILVGGAIHSARRWRRFVRAALILSYLACMLVLYLADPYAGPDFTITTAGGNIAATVIIGVFAAIGLTALKIEWTPDARSG